MPMPTPTATITVHALAEMLRSGAVTCEAADTDLRVDALADPRGPDCYATTTIDFLRGDEVIASVGCWVVGFYLHGPHQRDNGVWIGTGWQWQRESCDGQSCGIPRSRRVDVDSDTEANWDCAGTGLDGLTLPLGGGCTDEDVEAISAAIDAAYAEISVSPADDEDVATALQSYRSDADLEIETESCGSISCGLYAGIDAGRTVYTHDGTEEVWEDAEECVAAARKHLQEQIEAIDWEEAVEGLSKALKGKVSDE